VVLLDGVVDRPTAEIVDWRMYQANVKRSGDVTSGYDR
jgi:hypothetical protein